MKNIISYVLILVSLVIFGVRISKGIALKQNVSGILKRAADANTIQLANQELSKAITYLESKEITTGYTSIFYNTPDEDIDFWFRNLKASQNELQTLKSESALEKTNVLIKLRETLMDGGEKSKVTIPKGLDVYPHNILWAILSLIATACLSYGFVTIIVDVDKKSKEKSIVSNKR